MNNCKRVKSLIETSLNEAIKPSLQKEINAHVEQCNECAKYFKQMSGLQTLLSEQSAKENICPADIEQSLHLKLVSNAHKIRKKERVILGVKIVSVFSAVAALLLIFVFSPKTWFIENDDQISEPYLKIVKSEISKNNPVKITLEYISDELAENSEFSIKMKSGVHFFTKYKPLKDKKIHSWKDTLKKGVNKIPFMVKVDKKGIHKIETVAIANGKKYPLTVILETKDNGEILITYYKPKQNNVF